MEFRSVLLEIETLIVPATQCTFTGRRQKDPEILSAERVLGERRGFQVSDRDVKVVLRKKPLCHDFALHPFRLLHIVEFRERVRCERELDGRRDVVDAVSVCEGRRRRGVNVVVRPACVWGNCR